MVDLLLTVSWALVPLAPLVKVFVETIRLFSISERGKSELVGSVVIARHATENRGAVVRCGPRRR